jgi:hypothetical protein
MRKAERYGTNSAAAWRMLKTGIMSSSLTHLSIFTVDEIQHMMNLVLRKRAVDAGYVNGKPLSVEMKRAVVKYDKTQDLVSFTTNKFGVCALSILCGAFGAAIGTVIEPGRGTFVGALLGDNIVYLIV